MKICEYVEAIKKRENVVTNFIHVLQLGGWSDIGDEDYMENTHVCINIFADKFLFPPFEEGLGAFYGVFNGAEEKHLHSFLVTNCLVLLSKMSISFRK